jgi:hypothetical protein
MTREPSHFGNFAIPEPKQMEQDLVDLESGGARVTAIPGRREHHLVG